MNANKLKAISGLLAVAIGVAAVTGLAVVTIIRLGGDEKNSMVAVTSSAFGIISALVGAYLGIKITADTTARAGDNLKKAAVAEHEAYIAKEQVSAMEESAEERAPEQAEAIKSAAAEAREDAARTSPPTGGVG